MLANGSMRVADQDREAAVAMLRDAYVDGRLDLSELRDRAGAAYCARTWDDLSRLIADLPPRGGFPSSHGAGARAREDLSEARRGMFTPVLPVGLAWLAIAAGVFAPRAVIPLFVLSLVALFAVCLATRHKDTCQRKRLVREEQRPAEADWGLEAGTVAQSRASQPGQR